MVLIAQNRWLREAEDEAEAEVGGEVEGEEEGEKVEMKRAKGECRKKGPGEGGWARL